jgi:hypothetical protein
VHGIEKGRIPQNSRGDRISRALSQNPRAVSIQYPGRSLQHSR